MAPPSAGSGRQQSGIAAAPARGPELRWLKSQFRLQSGPTLRSTTAAGNGIFGCRDEAPKIVIQTGERPQRPKSGNRVAGNPRRKALFDVVTETRGLRRLD